jgi:hypothetical protein
MTIVNRKSVKIFKSGDRRQIRTDVRNILTAQPGEASKKGIPKGGQVQSYLTQIRLSQTVYAHPSLHDSTVKQDIAVPDYRRMIIWFIDQPAPKLNCTSLIKPDQVMTGLS